LGIREDSYMDDIKFNMIKDFSVPNNLPTIKPYTIPKEIEDQLVESANRKRKAEEAQIQSSDTLRKIEESQKRIEDILNNIFASGEDSVVVQKEIMKIMQENGVNDNFIRDKGIDGLIQAVFLAIQIFLKSKGIDF
jgi:hypothetical protein